MNVVFKTMRVENPKWADVGGGGNRRLTQEERWISLGILYGTFPLLTGIHSEGQAGGGL